MVRDKTTPTQRPKAPLSGEELATGMTQWDGGPPVN